MQKVKVCALILPFLAAGLAHAGGPMSGKMELIKCSSAQGALLANVQVSTSKYSNSPEAYVVSGGAASIRKSDGTVVNMRLKGFKKVYSSGVIYDLAGQDTQKNDFIVVLSSNPKDKSAVNSLSTGEKIALSCRAK